MTSNRREFTERGAEGRQLVCNPLLHLSLPRHAWAEEDWEGFWIMEGEDSRLFRKEANVRLLETPQNLREGGWREGGWREGGKDGWRDGRRDGRMEGGMDRRMEGWIEEWRERGKEEWRDGWKDGGREGS